VNTSFKLKKYSFRLLSTSSSSSSHSRIESDDPFRD
jgi:hypothetical protein